MPLATTPASQEQQGNVTHKAEKVAAPNIHNSHVFQLRHSVLVNEWELGRLRAVLARERNVDGGERIRTVDHDRTVAHDR
jgi:hypothetical protein